MLIKCPECSQDVSDSAPACPHCGKPISGSNVNIASFPSQPIKVEPQLTSKNWKKVKILGWLMIIGGFMIAGALAGSGPDAPWTGYGVSMLGVWVLVIGHVGAWYADKRTR